MSEPAARTARLTPDKARRRRSIAIALGLVAFFVLVYSVTMVRMHQNTRAGREAAAAAQAAQTTTPAAPGVAAPPVAAP